MPLPIRSTRLNGLAMEARLGRTLGRPIVAFNFGIPAAGPVTNALNLRRLLAAGVAPDLVLLEVLPAHLDGRGPEPVEAPFAVEATRLGSLLFCSHHEMLHAGQLGLIRRLLGKQPIR